jgi:hypothetical protein
MKLKAWQIQLLESIDGWKIFCSNKLYDARYKKEKILEMAKNGEPRPIHKNHHLGSILGHYINQNEKYYDADFDKQLRSIRPDWFISRSDIANQKKQQLLEIAKNREPKPHKKKHSLGVALAKYINPKNACYDQKFAKQIKSLRPDWFVSQSDISNQKKQQLLEIARSGEQKPSREKHPLGN